LEYLNEVAVEVASSAAIVTIVDCTGGDSSPGGMLKSEGFWTV
jgi:hypothetical protein